MILLRRVRLRRLLAFFSSMCDHAINREADNPPRPEDRVFGNPFHNHRDKIGEFFLLVQPVCRVGQNTEHDDRNDGVNG